MKAGEDEFRGGMQVGGSCDGRNQTGLATDRLTAKLDKPGDWNK